MSDYEDPQDALSATAGTAAAAAAASASAGAAGRNGGGVTNGFGGSSAADAFARGGLRGGATGRRDSDKDDYEDPDAAVQERGRKFLASSSALAQAARAMRRSSAALEETADDDTYTMPQTRPSSMAGANITAAMQGLNVSSNHESYVNLHEGTAIRDYGNLKAMADLRRNSVEASSSAPPPAVPSRARKPAPPVPNVPVRPSVAASRQAAQANPRARPQNIEMPPASLGGPELLAQQCVTILGCEMIRTPLKGRLI
ncbi:uncharacterized protein MONBRDRAFT_11086 [Monosiga brevicollis MX1]|uniref:Uncharacterized protein n=1 Tax=Monosiga brevicollis TaxID=81824 RepID=A9V861_MONBE|nr:uncharacterized protein MONBRDRAFT_11086 [Monosiga brevicollis MX1]EDQ86280.1 predicted protein [Monosiga brevicollis MX1]|eukprot:XP_001748950.1 hypothetical protein [Monosiga brevicollis MX1]